VATRLPGAARGVGFRSVGVRARTAPLADCAGRPVRLVIAAAGWIAFAAGLAVGIGIGLLAGDEAALPIRPETIRPETGTSPERPAGPRTVPRPCSVAARPAAPDDDLAFALGYLDDCRFGFARRVPIVTSGAVAASQGDLGTAAGSREHRRTDSRTTVASA